MKRNVKYCKKYKKWSFLISLLVFILTSITAFARVPDAINLAYFPGDGHIHSKDSWDASAYNDDIEELALAAEKEGLSWTIVTNHSDVVTRKWGLWGELIVRQVMTPSNWQNQISECQSVSQKLGITVLPGEEITIGNGTNLETRGHFLAYGLSKYVPSMYSQSDIKRRKGEDILSDIRSAGGFGFIAHPYKFGTWPIDAEPWKDWNLLNPYSYVIRGIEIVHNNHNPPQETINLWDRKLQQGREFFGIGNSDAHREGSVASGFTYLKIPNGNVTASYIYEALYNGRAIASNGPFITFNIKGKEPGDYVEAQKGDILDLNIAWATNPSDFSLKQGIEVYDQSVSCTDAPQPIYGVTVLTPTGTMTIPYEVKEEGYIRLRLITDKGKVAYTNPIFIKTPGTKSYQNVSVALIIDSSSSMINNDPQDIRKEAAKFFVDLAQVGDKIAVIDFDSGVHTWEPLREIESEADKEILKSGIDKIDSYGRTNISAALKYAYNELVSDKSDNPKGAILLTDGRQTVGPYTNEHRPFVEKGWPVYTIGLSGGIDINVLTRIASETNGKFYRTPTNENLVEIYRELSELFQSGKPIYQDNLLLLPNQIAEKTVNINPDVLQGTFSINWKGSEVELSLLDPQGSKITSATDDPDISHAKGSTYEIYRIDNPMPGEWKMRIQAVDVPPDGESVNLNISGLVETPPTVTINTPQESSIIRGTTTITAQATDDEEIVEFHLSLNGEELTESPDNINISYVWNTTEMPDGVYQLSAVATDIKKSFEQDDVMVIVDNTLPIADAGPDQTITAGSEVTLSASNSKDVDWFGYFWDFGDGTTATAVEPFITHTYSEPGTYTVKLTVCDAAGNMDTDIATVNVVPSTIPATVDIKPDTLNIRSKGRWITAYIELPDGYSLKEVEISTIKLNDVIPAQKSPFRIGDYDCDGIPDLMVKFDRSSVKEFLDDPEETLTVTGKIRGKTFSGSDSIKVIFSKCKKRNLLKKVLQHKHCNFYNPEKYWKNICFIWKVIRCLLEW